jgi:hypothetical protein
LILEVTVFDLTGRVVRSASLQSESRMLDVSGLPAASYLVEARAEGNLRQTVQMVVLD